MLFDNDTGKILIHFLYICIIQRILNESEDNSLLETYWTVL